MTEYEAAYLLCRRSWLPAVTTRILDDVDLLCRVVESAKRNARTPEEMREVNRAAKVVAVCWLGIGRDAAEGSK